MDSLTEFLSRPVYEQGHHPGQSTWELWTLDYELVHQLILKSLCEDAPPFLDTIVPPTAEGRECRIEPNGKRFDLLLTGGPVTAVFEIKVWSPLRRDQIQRQIQSAKYNGYQLIYLLLGRIGARWSSEDIRKETDGIGAKISYRELIDSLERVIASDCSNTLAISLATSYRAALIAQRERINRGNWGNPDL